MTAVCLRTGGPRRPPCMARSETFCAYCALGPALPTAARAAGRVPVQPRERAR